MMSFGNLHTHKNDGILVQNLASQIPPLLLTSSSHPVREFLPCDRIAPSSMVPIKAKQTGRVANQRAPSDHYPPLEPPPLTHQI